jgi:lysophospholipase L1-like esterase
MASTRRRPSFLPFLTLIGPVACSSAHNDAPADPGNGTQVETPTSSSSSSSGGGEPTPTGSSGAAPNSSGAGGSSGSSSGSDVGSSSGSSGSGSSSGGTGSGGSLADASTGHADSGGGGSSSGAAPPPPPASDGGVPSGYPAATAADYAKCQTVPIGATACAGTPAGNVCIECLFGGSTYNNAQTPDALGTSEAGNYVVTVQMGGAAAGQTGVWAESSRSLLAPVTTAAGQMVEYAFVVNARAMEGQPNHAGGPGGYPGLDLFFTGPTATPPQVSAIGYALATPATKPIMLYIASDSTACDQTGGAFGGWGQMLPEYFAPPIGVSNYANSGASSSSFMGAYWGDITSRWVAGDYVIVQFGHNDKGVADATVQANLEKYITQALAANVTPIIVSPPARVQFGAGATDGDQSSLHAVAAKAAAAAHNVAYIDLTALSTAWYNTLGSQAAALKFHANDSDATHTNLVGGEKLAGLVTTDMKTQNLPIAKYLRP